MILCSRVNIMMGMMTSCTCARISGADSTDETIYVFNVSIGSACGEGYVMRTVPMVFATPIAA